MITTQIGVLQSVQVGSPRHYGVSKATDPMERRWQTSFFRTPSTEPRWLYTTHLDGNAQADLKHHGSLTQAVLLYAASNYLLWQAELRRQDIGPGGFGENFTIDGLNEETACIGDIYALGAARIQVTGPRYPCWKIERRWGLAGLTARVAETGRTGWYCSVLHEGMIEPAMPVTLIERPYPQWSMALINDFAHGRNKDIEQAQALSACPLLHEFWAELIMRNVTKKQ
jgi:MOSC domain-containing protein YiiM